MDRSKRNISSNPKENSEEVFQRMEKKIQGMEDYAAALRELNTELSNQPSRSKSFELDIDNELKALKHKLQPNPTAQSPGTPLTDNHQSSSTHYQPLKQQGDSFDVRMGSLHEDMKMPTELVAEKAVQSSKAGKPCKKAQSSHQAIKYRRLKLIWGGAIILSTFAGLAYLKSSEIHPSESNLRSEWTVQKDLLDAWSDLSQTLP